MKLNSKICIIFFAIFMQNMVAAKSVWQDSQKEKVNLFTPEIETMPKAFRLLEMDNDKLDEVLNANNKAETTMDIPMPDGGEECFVLEAANWIQPNLSEKRTDIKTFRAWNANNPKQRLYIVKTKDDFYVIGDSDKGTFFVDRVMQGNQKLYVSYFAKDAVKPPFQCGVEHEEELLFRENEILENASQSIVGNAWGTELRKYRMAIMWTSGHSASYNNDTTAMVNRDIEIIADMNYVCERDLCITFELAINPDSLIFSDPATDPYDGLGSITGIINGKIGSENYEIGFAVNGGGGGVSYLGVTCGGAKAGSQCSNDHWTIVHELGHNMGAGHMMNYCPNWGGNNMEPGAGNSIMSYGSTGVCGGGHQVPNGRIDYFHGRSIEQMYNVLFLNTNCAENIATNNNPPAVSVPNGGFYIPISTPFELEGSATDPDGDANFTYSWQQFDSGVGSPPWEPTALDPLFQLFPHDTSPIRTFPKIESIINGYNYGEVLPTVSRTLNFRFYARDNFLIGSGVAYDELQFFVDGNTGPFEVNYPNGNTAVWAVGQTSTVTWNVANTDQMPVNCALVDILLSTDGGYTYPFILAENVPNNGSYEIVVPDTIGTENRIKIAAADNVFFDISDENFEIVAADTYDFIAFVNETNKSVCDETSSSYQINTLSIGTFSNTIDLSLTGLPAGANANMAATISANDVQIVELTDLDMVAAGSYDMVLSLTETGGSLSKTINLSFVKKDNLITFSPDKAMNFDGTGQVHISKNNADFDFGTDKNFSIELWTKTNTTSGDDALISDKDWNSGGYKGWVIAMQSGNLTFNVGSGSGNRVDIGSGEPYNDNEWHHIAISFDRTDTEKVAMYVDGELKSEKGLLNLGDITQDNDVVIGADKNNNYRYEGLIDEVRIWKKALNAAEIRENMHRIIDVCEADLISCYQFNETDGDALDAFSSHHGTISNSTRLESTAPFGPATANSQTEMSGNVIFSNTAFEADYSYHASASVTATKINISPNATTGIETADVVLDNQYWAINRYENDGELNFDATFAVAENITLEQLETPSIFKLYHRNFNADSDWSLITFASYGNDVNNTLTFENVPTYGQFLIARANAANISVFENALHFCNLEINGESEILSYQIEATFLEDVINITAPNGFEISTNENADFSNTLNVTPTENTINLTTIYVRFVGETVGEYDATIQHTSPNATTRTLQVTGKAVISAPYQAIVCDGNTNIHIPKTNDDFNFGTEKDFSIDFWTKTTTTSSDDAIISDKDWDSGSYVGWVVAMQSGKFVFNAGTGGGRVDIGSGSGTYYNDNEWHHVAISFSRVGDGAVGIYVDGVLKQEKNLIGLGNIDSPHDVVIGADKDNGYDYEGTIDEVRFWNKALNETEIRESMHLIYTGCQPNLIANYHLDEESGDILDALGQHHGTPNNVTSVVSSAPIGPGNVETQAETNGTVIFASTHFEANYSTHDNKNITAFNLHLAPYGLDGIGEDDVLFGENYWILNAYDNFGDETFDATFMLNENLTTQAATTPSNFKLYGRAFNADASWTLVANANSANEINNSLTFQNISQYGQYVIVKTEIAYEIQAKIFLEAAYETNAMTTHLLNNNLIPSEQPFNAAPWNYAGTENANGVFPENITDWVLLEVRDMNNLAEIAEQRAAFVRNDGVLLDIDGSEGVSFSFLNETTNYQLIVRHRNHLDIASEMPLVLPQTTVYDFTQIENVLDGENQLATNDDGTYSMKAGDINADGFITIADLNDYLLQLTIINQYNNSDVDLDGDITISDFDFYDANASAIGASIIQYE